MVGREWWAAVVVSEWWAAVVGRECGLMWSVSLTAMYPRRRIRGRAKMRRMVRGPSKSHSTGRNRASSPTKKVN